MKRILFLSLFCGLAVCLSACTPSSVSEGEEKPLYEGAAPGSEDWDWPEFRLDNPADGQTYVANVTTPTLKAFLPTELHYFAACEHGHGYKDNGDPVNDWITLLWHFMQKTGFCPSI